MRKFVENEHFRYRRDRLAKADGNELDLSGGVSISISARESPLLRQMRKDFTRFLRKCMGVSAGGEAGIQIVFKLDKTSGGQNDKSAIDCRNNRLIISAPHERGLLHACHYLENLMARRGGPFIPRKKIERQRLFDPYISQPVFHDSDANLSLMSHFGVNGIWRTVSLWQCCQSNALPELNHPDHAGFVREIRGLCRRAAVYGMDLYLDISSWGGLDARHKVFQAHPEARGAEFYYSIEGSQFQLCSSSRLVRQCYRQSLANLFEEIPELGGVNLIIGGEGLLHCFTRPKPPVHGRTNCPHCRGHNPSKDVADLVNGITAAIHQVKPSAKVFVWPYSAHMWSGEKDPAQTEFIGYLRRDICFLSNFETPFRVGRNGADAWLFDYNILNIGPSRPYSAQTRALAKRGMPHYAKTESSTTVFFIFPPYIPVHYRWFDRFKKIRESGAPGILAKWDFYGFTGSLPEELLYEFTWNKTIDADRTLATVVRRDFGRQADIKKVLDAWKQMSRAWEQIPKSHSMFGERHGYFKGPFWLGPAHPLIFDAQNHYGLSHKFLDRAIGRIFAGPARANRDTPHKYSSDLLFTYPFTPAYAESALRRTIREWDAGLELLVKAMGAAPSPKAVMEANVCASISAQFHSVYNVIRFYRARDDLFTGKGSVRALLAKTQNLKNIISAEITNAESSLPVLARDPRIGFGKSYGQVYDAPMIREKIRQCIFVRDIEIPFLTRRFLEFNHLYF